MANLDFSISTPDTTGVVLPADTNPHTVLQVLAPANHRVKLKKFSLGFRGTTVTNAPLTVQLVKQSTAGAGGSSVTPRNVNAVAETVQSTAISGPTTEPTLTEVWESWTIHPQLNGGFQLPMCEEYIVPGSGRVALRVIDPGGNGNTCHATMVFEE